MNFDKPIVSDRFKGVIYAHLVLNLQPNPLSGTPLILAIHGHPGTGKSFQLREVLCEYGVETQQLASSDFEDQFAGEPAKIIRRAYVDSGVNANGKPRALVVNDLDAAIGQWGDLVQSTTNRQHVLGELLSICDEPTGLDSDPTLRTPIFITANDLTKLYQPLVRTGRARFFYWEPSHAELTRIVAGIYCDSLDLKEVAELIDRVGSTRVSDYSDLLNSYAYAQLRQSAIAPEAKSDFDKVVAGALSFKLRVRFEDIIDYLEDWRAEREAIGDYSKWHSGGGV